MDRRQFLGGAGGAIALAVVSPKDLLARGLDPTLIVKVDDLEGDLLSRDYRDNGADSYISRSLETTREFYATMGNQYRLPGVNIDTNYEGNSSGSSDKVLQFRYTSLDRLTGELEKDPDLIDKVLGEEAADRARRMGLEDMRRDLLLSKFRSQAREAGGASLPGSGEVFLISRDFYNEIDTSSEEYTGNLVKLLAYINGHELGHVFDLDHVEGQPRNIMTVKPCADTILNPTLSREQVAKVLEYFA
tara:strand:- start:790 stop:1527 length:738 start_codon:yes stop_codon:yes gene_type:complete